MEGIIDQREQRPVYQEKLLKTERMISFNISYLSSNKLKVTKNTNKVKSKLFSIANGHIYFGWIKVLLELRRLLLLLFFPPCPKKCTLLVILPTFGTQLSIVFFYTSMEHINHPEQQQEEVPLSSNFHQNNEGSTPEEPKNSRDQERLNLSEKNEGGETNSGVEEDKENTNDTTEGFIGTTEDSVFPNGEVATCSANEVQCSLQTDKQDSNLQKQPLTARNQIVRLNPAPLPSKVPPKDPRKTKPLIYQRQDSSYYCYIGDDDQNDYYEDDQDQMMQISDDSESEVDSDDQEPSDDSLPDDYDEEEMPLSQILQLWKIKGYKYTKEQFLANYIKERKSLEEEDKKLKKFQITYGINMPFQLQLEKDSLNQSAIQFFNRHYLTYLELNGGKKKIKIGEPAPESSEEPQKESHENQIEPSENQAGPSQQKSLYDTLKELQQKSIFETNSSSKLNPTFREDLESQESSSTLPKTISKRRVMFNDQVNLKVFKEDEEVTVMNATQQVSEELNNKEKKCTIKRMMPMTLDFLKKTNQLNSSNQSGELTVTQLKNNSKGNVFVICPPKKQATTEQKTIAAEQKGENKESEEQPTINGNIHYPRNSKKEEQVSTYSEESQNQNTIFQPQRKKSYADLYSSPAQVDCPRQAKQQERIKDSIITLMNST